MMKKYTGKGKVAIFVGEDGQFLGYSETEKLKSTCKGCGKEYGVELSHLYNREGRITDESDILISPGQCKECQRYEEANI